MTLLNFFRIKKFILLIIANITIILVSSVSAEAFVKNYQYSQYNPAGFFSGIWHGLLSPYSLVARWFMDDVVMYAIPNTGWFYDASFLIGVSGSLPVGWLAAIISTIGHILF